MKRVLVTGSRDWTDEDTVRLALTEAVKSLGWEYITVVHGDCPTGADRMAAEWVWNINRAENTRNVAEAHPADWKRHGKAAGPLRNKAMVDLGADLCLAFPLGVSRGTHNCMMHAEAAGIPVIVYTPQKVTAVTDIQDGLF